MAILSPHLIGIFKSNYFSNETKEQKAKEIIGILPEMHTYREDLESLFGYSPEELPIIEGVAVETNQIGKNEVFMNVVVTKMPVQVLPEVQKTIMRIAGYLSEFQCQRWRMGRIGEHGGSAERHFKEYLNNHPDVTPLYLESDGRHKVLVIDYEDIEGGTYVGYCVYEMKGILLD